MFNEINIKLPLVGKDRYIRYQAWAEKFVSVKKYRGIAWALVSAWLDHYGYELVKRSEEKKAA
jgi:hypothetical protein